MRGAEQGTDGDSGAHQALEHAEDARQHLGWCRALQERPARDVEQAVRRTRDDEEEHRGDDGGEERQQDESGRPGGQSADDRGNQPRAPDERRRDGDRERAAETERCVQVPRTPVPHSEHAHREHDVEDVQHPECDLLRSEQADERSCRWLAHDDREPLDELLLDARARRRIGGRAGNHHHEQRSSEHGGPHDEKHPARAGDSRE